MKHPKAPKQEEAPQIFVLNKLMEITKFIRRNGSADAAEVAAQYEQQFVRELETAEKKAA